jgi:hypothetical protein
MSPSPYLLVSPLGVFVPLWLALVLIDLKFDQ